MDFVLTCHFSLPMNKNMSVPHDADPIANITLYHFFSKKRE
ncbi:hypothetical protein JCM19237_638 [Photobacterium aphoticum]|uniref:Uncharacterized protein n=1 Tax=Photobacterium aphoticum TaxID=754436 RepID=A0A090QTH8_9GAMM|nr:hypothetical protein JCM19237_638 [Photobacterium aphoticum]